MKKGGGREQVLFAWQVLRFECFVTSKRLLRLELDPRVALEAGEGSL